jgi:hypothetical protein
MGSLDLASAAVLLVTVLIAVIAAGSLIKERKKRRMRLRPSRLYGQLPRALSLCK